jgi:hypothetical protein|nr:MAG TPA: hypothetical protein [Caudoviricetes sp.]
MIINAGNPTPNETTFSSVFTDGNSSASADGIDYNRFEDNDSTTELFASLSSDRVSFAKTDIDASIRAFLLSKNIEALKSIKYSLDKIFPGSKCLDIIYTENTDKMFFGINVCPVLNAKRIFDILQSDDPYIVSEYYLEIDSQIMDTVHSHNITDCIVYDVAAMVSDASPMRKAQSVLDEYLISTNSVLKYSDSIHYQELLSFGIRDAMKKLTSMFYVGLDNLNEELLNIYGIAPSNVLNLLRSLGKVPFTKAESPIVVLSWVMRLYNSVLKYRIAARHTIKKGIKYTGSQLDRKELDNIYRRLDRIDDAAVIREDLFMGVANAISGQLKDMKVKGISKYEDDFYEIQFEANNLETQEEAMILLHRINSRMGVIADFLATEELNATSRKRWTKLLDEYNKLRNAISRQKIYQNKTRLYVNYGYDD